MYHTDYCNVKSRNKHAYIVRTQEINKKISNGSNGRIMMEIINLLCGVGDERRPPEQQASYLLKSVNQTVSLSSRRQCVCHSFKDRYKKACGIRCLPWEFSLVKTVVPFVNKNYADQRH